MENAILDFTDTLAKRWHEQNAGAIAAARARGLWPVFPSDSDELVKPAPAPRRQRKRSLAKVCEVARKAGANHVIVDGVVIAFSPAASAAVPESTANEWDAVLSGGDHGPH